MRLLLSVIVLFFALSSKGATGTPSVTTKTFYVNNGGNLTSVKNLASAGDTIEVSSGASLIGGTNMLKPGVNWNFLGQGTLIVTNKDTTQRCAMFDDNGVATTNLIYAPGWTFIYSNGNGTMTIDKGMVLQVSNPASNIKFVAKAAKIGVDTAGVGHSVIRIINAQQVVLDVNEVRGDTDLTGDEEYYGLRWEDGRVSARIAYLTGERNGLKVKGTTISTNLLTLQSDTIQAFAEAAISIQSNVPTSKIACVTSSTLMGRGNPNVGLDQQGGWLILNVGSISNTIAQTDTNPGWSAAIRVGGGRLTLNAAQVISPRRLLYFYDLLGIAPVVDVYIKEASTLATTTYDAVLISNVLGNVTIDRLNAPDGRGVYVGGTNAVILTANIKTSGSGATNEPIFLDGTGVYLKNCVLDAPTTVFAIKATTTNQPIVLGTLSMRRPATNINFISGLVFTNTSILVP